MPLKGLKHHPESIEKNRLAHLGKKLSDKTKEKLSKKFSGEKNPMYGKFDEKHPAWKGDDIGRCGLHQWVRKHLPIPEKCQFCHELKNLDLANTIGVYNRDLKNWVYLCRSCHCIYDGKINNLYKTRQH